MIKFFRKIRQHLLTENKFSKYVLYASGEIILVVIGILIALSINNWNESRKLDSSEKEFITSVKEDLIKDKEYIKLVIALIEPRINAYKVLRDNESDLFRIHKNSLDSIFQIYFNSQRTFYPISGSYQSAVSGNQLNSYRNKNLVQEIIKLYNSTYSRLIENGQFLDERWAFISKKYSRERRTGHFLKRSPEEVSSFLDDLYHHYIQMEWYLKMLQDTEVKIEKITRT